MNKEIQAEMRKELIQSKKGSGFLAGFACFLTFFFIESLVPSLREFVKANHWAAFLVIAVSCIVGYLYGQWRLYPAKIEIQGYDDDVLKFKHEELKHKKLTGFITSALSFAVVALIAAYIFLK